MLTKARQGWSTRITNHIYCNKLKGVRQMDEQKRELMEEVFREKLTDPAEVRRILKEIFED